MDVLIDVVLPLALAFIMFSLGLGLTPADFARVAKRPKAFGIGAVNQVVLLPAVVFGIVLLFGLTAELAVGFMILAACPGGVTSNVISKLAKADVALSVSLTAVISLVSAVTVPLLIAWSMTYFLGSEAPPVNVAGIALTMFALTVVPILIGLVLRMRLPDWAERREPLIARVAAGLFFLIVVAAVAGNWSLFVENLKEIGRALVLLLVVLLVLGFTIPRVFGLGLGEAKTISIETGIQNSTLGITVAALLTPAETGFGTFALPAAVYGVLMYITVFPAILWFRRLED